MPATKTETLSVNAGAEVVSVRHRVRSFAVEMGFSLVEQTKIVTAASELARNMVDYVRGGGYRQRLSLRRRHPRDL